MEKNGKYMSSEGIQAARDEAKDAELKRRWQKVWNVCGLVIGDGLLMFMILADKIDLAYGLVFLAAASAIFGYCLK